MNESTGTLPALQRPMRADARRNRDLVLAAAQELFAAGGLKVQVTDVAKAAGLGVGTVCRHFPTKRDLVDAVLDTYYAHLRDLAVSALDDPDPWTAFEALVSAVSDMSARYRALAEEMRETVGLSPTVEARKQELRDAVRALVTRGQAAGVLRDDVGPADVLVLLSGVANAAALRVGDDLAVRERFVRIALDGLRSADPTPLPGRPLEFADLER